MGKRNASVWGDNALREFYLSCGLKPEVVEGAIRMRHEPMTSVQAAKRVATWKANRLAKLTKRDR